MIDIPSIRYSISLYPTDTPPLSARRAASVEPEASLRADLVAQVAGAQAQIESDIEQLRRAAAVGGDTAALAQAEGQLQGLGNLQRRIEQAGPGALAAIRAEVVAFVAASQVTAQLLRTATATAQAAEVALHAASEAAHRTVSDLADEVFGKKKYDAYLHFASTEEEEAYRKRSEDRERYIKDQLALGTPEGNLNAARAMQAQLKDAGAHGADAHPDYGSDLTKVDSSIAKLENAMAVNHPKTQEVEARALAIEEKPAASTSVELDAVAAQLRAAGVIGTPASTKGHGVTLQVADAGKQRGWALPSSLPWLSLSRVRGSPSPASQMRGVGAVLSPR